MYHILSKQWLRKTHPRVIFSSSNTPKKRFRICLSEDRQYLVLYSFCYADFLRYYYSAQGKVVDENDQPEQLLDELVEENHMLKNNLLKRYSSYVK